MPSYTNALGAVSRRGQWRFRHVFRSLRADGRTDMSDAGLVDFGAVTAAVLTVAPRRPYGRGWPCDAPADPVGAEPQPVLSASLADEGLALLNPGVVEAVFPAGALLAFPPGLYDVRVLVTVGPETEEVFAEPIEFT